MPPSAPPEPMPVAAKVFQDPPAAIPCPALSSDLHHHENLAGKSVGEYQFEEVIGHGNFSTYHNSQAISLGYK